jgi:hypothetical protein
MADLKLTKLYAGANLRQGMLVYRAERKGLFSAIARAVYHKTKWRFLERYSYEVLPSIREDEFSRPIGIAIDEKTILVGGTLDGFPAPKNTPVTFDGKTLADGTIITGKK